MILSRRLPMAFLLASALLGAACASSIPKPVPGEPIQTWVVAERGSADADFLLKVRNDSAQTLRINYVLLTDCYNIRQLCDEKFPWGAVLGPGEIADMKVNLRDPSSEGWFRPQVFTEPREP